MGNIVSQDQGSKKKSLEQVINYIVFKYIRSQNFQDMKKLADLEYCDKLVLLTSKIISKYLDDTNIKYLSQKKGIGGEQMAREKVLAIDKNDIDKFDVKNPTKKRRLCIGLAKHYIRIANLFAAIATTINPKYDYVDSEGSPQSVNMEQKTEIPDDTTPKISRNNLCSNRVAALLNNQDISTLDEKYKSGSVTLNPNICSFNCSTCPVTKNLGQEPGIPELELLYYDKYDYDTGKFVGMTPTMAQLYKEDVDELYKTFTGNDAVPETINNFSDIKLKDYYNTTSCEDGTYKQPVQGSSTNTKFYSYIVNIKAMLEKTNEFHNALLDILDKLFVYGVNPETNDKTVIVNPNLTDSILEDLTKQTIKLINALYISCESHFATGVKIYTNIAKKQFLTTTKHQLVNLKTTLDDLSKTKAINKSEITSDPNQTIETPAIVIPKSSTGPTTSLTSPTGPTTSLTSPTGPTTSLTSPTGQTSIDEEQALIDKTSTAELETAELLAQTAAVEAETAITNATIAKLNSMNTPTVNIKPVTKKIPTNLPIMSPTPQPVVLTPTPEIPVPVGNISSVTPTPIQIK